MSWPKVIATLVVITLLFVASAYLMVAFGEPTGVIHP